MVLWLIWWTFARLCCQEVVKSEIEVMNQLNHANLIQLYAAFESRHEIVLVLE